MIKCQRCSGIHETEADCPVKVQKFHKGDHVRIGGEEHNWHAGDEAIVVGSDRRGVFVLQYIVAVREYPIQAAAFRSKHFARGLPGCGR